MIMPKKDQSWTLNSAVQWIVVLSIQIFMKYFLMSAGVAFVYNFAAEKYGWITVPLVHIAIGVTIAVGTLLAIMIYSVWREGPEGHEIEHEMETEQETETITEKIQIDFLGESKSVEVTYPKIHAYSGKKPGKEILTEFFDELQINATKKEEAGEPT